MKKWAVLGSVACLVLGVFVAAAYCDGESVDLMVDIRIAPNTIVLGAPGAMVTVHAGIPYGAVDTSTVTLNGVPARICFPDDRGNLVAKFLEGLIEDIVAPPSATLTLEGMTKDGEVFAGSGTVQVKAGSGKK